MKCLIGQCTNRAAALRAVVGALALWLASVPLLAAERFGGIEIGAKGVKVAAVEVDREAASVKVLDIDKKTVDLSIARLQGLDFKTASVEAVADTVDNFKKVLTETLKVPAKNIVVVASSGVPFAKNLDELINMVRAKSGLELEKISAAEEGELTVAALIPAEQRTRTLVVDIGGGTIKGGIFARQADNTEKFIPFTVEAGTVTIAQAIETRSSESPSKEAAAEVVGREKIGDPIRKLMAAHPEFGRAESVLLSGGAVWAMVTFTQPQVALELYPPITARQIRGYSKLVTAAGAKYPLVDFASITDVAAREAAQKDVNAITQEKKPIFTSAELYAGSVLLRETLDALNSPNASMYFDRKAVTAWITARITPPEMRGALPVALGRAVPKPAAKTSAVEGRDGWRRFGGIEIGGKGVKVTAIDYQKGMKPSLRVVNVEKYKSFNASIAKLKKDEFSRPSVSAVVDVVAELFDALVDDLSIAEGDISIVASSGVPIANNLEELTRAIKQRTGRGLGRVDANEEGLLTFQALVPGEISGRTMVIDFGSSNVKGGVLFDDDTQGGVFLPIKGGFGATTLSSAQDANATAKLPLSTFVHEKFGLPLEQLSTQNPALAERDIVLLAGGSVWAMLTWMRPEAALDDFPAIQFSDISAWMQRIEQAGDAYPGFDLAKVKQDDVRAAAQKDYARITGKDGGKPVFSPAELKNGATLIWEAAQALNLKDRNIYFDRKAMTAWITAFVTPAEARNDLPSAFGRQMPRLPRRTIRSSWQLNELFGAGAHAFFAHDYDLAETRFTKAIDIGSRDARNFLFRGIVKMRRGDRDGALLDFREGSDLVKAYPDENRLLRASLERIQGRERMYIENFRLDMTSAAASGN